MEPISEIQRAYGKGSKRVVPGLKLFLVRGSLTVLGVVAVALVIPQSRSGILSAKGDLEHSQGFNEAALGDYAGSLSAVPENSVVREKQAELLYQLGRDSDAITAYKELLKVPAMATNARARLVRLYLRTNKVDLAQQCCDQWIAEQPKSGAAYQAQGRVLEAQKRNDDAIDAYSKSVELGGGEGPRLDKDSLLQKMRFSNAFEPLAEIHVSNKNDYRSLLQDAINLGTGQEYRRSMQLVDRAIAMKPKCPDAYSLRAMLKTVYHHSKDAIADYITTDRLRRQHPELSNTLDVPMSAQGFFNSGVYYWWETNAYLDCKDYKNALIAINKEIAARQSAKNFNMRAYVYRCMGDVAHSRADLELARRSPPDTNEMVDVLSNMCGK